ncbi:MAG TPA: hypothetical protein VG939_22075 [Caulobacteraceae bacterium]|nr:hypothetical protein [Caulobacteraceae bacterium]
MAPDLRTQQPCSIALDCICLRAGEMDALRTMYLEIVCQLRCGAAKDAICRDLGISRGYLNRLIVRIRCRDPVVFLDGRRGLA